MKTLNIIAQVLLVVGGLNWGLVGLFDFNLVAALFGLDSFLSNTVYILVGLAGLYGLYLIATLSKASEANVVHGGDNRTVHHGRHQTRPTT